MNRRKFFGLLAAAPLAPLVTVGMESDGPDKNRMPYPGPWKTGRYPFYMGDISHPLHSRFALPPEKIAEIYRDMLAVEFGLYDIPTIMKTKQR